MDNNIAVDDLRTFFVNTVCMYNNKPVKVREISYNKVFHMLDLLTQKTIIAPDALKNISPPVRRLGMINLLSSVLYLKRMPYRKYQVGINKNNTKIETLIVPYPQGRDNTKAICSDFSSPDLANCLLNRYPSIKECWEFVNEFEGAMAFDKQFAVDYSGQIFYKTLYVGVLKGKKKTVSDIVFNEDYKHLILLLDGNHEKTIRDFGPTTVA